MRRPGTHCLAVSVVVVPPGTIAMIAAVLALREGVRRHEVFVGDRVDLGAVHETNLLG